MSGIRGSGEGDRGEQTGDENDGKFHHTARMNRCSCGYRSRIYHALLAKRPGSTFASAQESASKCVVDLTRSRKETSTVKVDCPRTAGAFVISPSVDMVFLVLTLACADDADPRQRPLPVQSAPDGAPGPSGSRAPGTAGRAAAPQVGVYLCCMYYKSTRMHANAVTQTHAVLLRDG